MIQKSDSISKGSGTILLADDEPLVIEVATHLLNVLGYEVITSTNGMETVQTYRNQKKEIDMILLDLIMPDMDAEEVYDQLKSENPEVKVLLSSGYNFNEEVAKIIDKGCNGFVLKPFDLKTLSLKIREIITSSP